MATINATIYISTTVSTLDAATIQAILTWIDVNIRQKLPAGSTVTVQLNVAT